MNPVGSKSITTYARQPSHVDHAKGSEHTANTSSLKGEQNKVTLSSEGKALLAALQQIDHESNRVNADNDTMADKVESFAHGALGMDHPDTIKEEDDGSYSAGQYLSAALTVGGVLLALV
ncbi:hypothetical protein [Vibrio alfacsensis]|uniref:hypothetical protein n=1 Tax=Vibrio alfacsensis TaxID=1074311 RepID=UPI004068C8AA